MPRRRRTFQPFSVSFLDCICCGFGAVILLFVLTSGKKAEYRNNQLSDVQIDVGKLTKSIELEEEEIKKLREQLREKDRIVEELNRKAETLDDQVIEQQRELQLVLNDRSALEESLALLLGELDELPKVEDAVPIPIANPIKRQYLTDFKLDGERVMILVETSGGMLADNPDDAVQAIMDTDEDKRNASKWKRAVRAVEWLVANLRPPTEYQIYLFSAESDPLIEGTADRWFDLMNKERTAEVIESLNEVVPTGPANLERAFWTIRSMVEMPDNLIIVCDGLPTSSDTLDPGGVVDQSMRISMFDAAVRQAPLGIPMNIIMLPFSGDPAAPSLFWQLATNTRGSFICPSPSWPNL